MSMWQNSNSLINKIMVKFPFSYLQAGKSSPIVENNSEGLIYFVYIFTEKNNWGLMERDLRKMIRN